MIYLKTKHLRKRQGKVLLIYSSIKKLLYKNWFTNFHAAQEGQKFKQHENGLQWKSRKHNFLPNFPISTTFSSYLCSDNSMCVCVCVCAKLLQSCPTLCDPIDQRLPGCSVHGILQARVLEWVAMSSSRGSSQPRDQIQVSLSLLHWQAGSLLLALPGKPIANSIADPYRQKYKV